MSHRYYWAVTQNLRTDVRECIWTIFLKQRKKNIDKRGQRKEGDKTRQSGNGEPWLVFICG